MHHSDDALALEMARRFAAAGIVVPPERAAGAVAAAQRLLEVAHWLRRPREAASEPAHLFSAGEPRS